MSRSIVIKLLAVVLLLGGLTAAQINLGPNGQIQVKGTLGPTYGGSGQNAWVKGNILCGTGSNTTGVLTVGTNGYQLQADSTQTCGFKWAAPATAPVTSVFSRTGTVVASNNDYFGSQTVSTNSTLTLTLQTTVVEATGGVGGITVTMPAASSNSYAVVIVKKVDSGAGAVTVGRTGSDTFDGAASISLATQWSFTAIASDGSNWYVIASTGGGGGTSVNVNGSGVSNPNFNGTTPAAPASNVNVTWQVSSSSVSGYVPNTITVNGTSCTLGGSCSPTSAGGNNTYTSVNNQTGTTYTLVLGDAGGYVRMNNAASNTLTIPPNSSVAFPVGTIIVILQKGAGQTTVAPGSGVTINTPTSLSTRAQWSTVSLTKVGTDEWDAAGDLQ